MMTTHDWVEFVRNTTTFTGFFYVVPMAASFLLTDTSALTLTREMFFADLFRSLLVALAVSLVLVGRDLFTRRRKGNART